MKELRELRDEIQTSVGTEHGGVLDRLFDLLEEQARRIERLEKENERLRQRLVQYEPKVNEQDTSQPLESDAAGTVANHRSEIEDHFISGHHAIGEIAPAEVSPYQVDGGDRSDSAGQTSNR